jgi:hypothetical protein
VRRLARPWARPGSHLCMSTRDIAIAALTVLVIVVIIAFVL